MTVNVENKPDLSNQDKTEANLPQQKVETTAEQIENKPVENHEDPNWRAFREARKKDRAEREAAERRAAEKEAETAALKAAMEAAFSRGSPVQNRNDYDSVEESEDERIEKKVQAAIAQRDAANERARREREKNELPDRLMEAFPDYNNVVNDENGAYLEYHHPELYRSLLRQPENFQTCSDIYKIVKKLVPNSTTSKKEAARADYNFSKPKSISSTGVMQSGEAKSPQILSSDKKAANWARMQSTLKGLSS